MSKSQNDSGRAFEYGIAIACTKFIPAAIVNDSHMLGAKRAFERVSPREQEKITKASDSIIMFLKAHDSRLTDNHCTVSLQSSQAGGDGDVRDVLIHNTVLGETVGISAKNRHFAVKSQRLSEDIDFGRKWMGTPCSAPYFHTVTPIFRELKSRRRKGEMWRDIEDKHDRFYMPVLQALQTEITLLSRTYPDQCAPELVKYLLGRHDYYKIIKENGHVSLFSFKLNNSDQFGSRIPLPTRIMEVAIKPRSKTTLFFTFDQGWQMAFRIHSAASLIETSLKFDVTIIGNPFQLTHHTIDYMNERLYLG